MRRGIKRFYFCFFCLLVLRCWRRMKTCFHDNTSLSNTVKYTAYDSKHLGTCVIPSGGANMRLHKINWLANRIPGGLRTLCCHPSLQLPSSLPILHVSLNKLSFSPHSFALVIQLVPITVIPLNTYSFSFTLSYLSELLIINGCEVLLFYSTGRGHKFSRLLTRSLPTGCSPMEKILASTS